MNAGAYCSERVLRLSDEWNAIVLENARHYELRHARDRAALGAELSWPPTAMRAHVVEQAKAASGLRGDAVCACPCLEEIELTALIEEVLERRRVATTQVRDVNQFAYFVESSLPLQNLAPRVVDAPHV